MAPSRTALLIYRALVRLGPRDARERFGDEQVRLFERLWRDERPRTALRGAIWTVGQLWGAAWSAIAAWRDRAGPWRSPILKDVRYAGRGLWRAPWYSVTTIGVLSASVALVTTAFAVVDGVLFKPLPYARANELHLVRVDITAKPTVEPPPVAGWDLAAWADAVPELGVAGVGIASTYSLEKRDYGAVGVDEHFFEVLGTRPLVGDFAPEDFGRLDLDNPAGIWQPLLVSYAVWQRQFGGDGSIVGRAVTVTTTPQGRPYGYRVRGVLAPDFAVPLDLGPVAPDILMPMAVRDVRESFAKFYQLIVRVPPSVSAVTVRDRLLAATRQRALAPPRVPDPRVFEHHEAANWRPEFDDLRLVPIAEHLGWRNRQAFAMVFAAAATLLLLACVNVAGLAAGRSLDRRRELAVRRALGASNWALARELIAETALIASLSTGAALLLVRPLLRATLDLLPASVALLKTPAIDARVFGASTLFAVAIVAIVVWWPARVAASVSLLVELGRGGNASSRPGRRSTFLLVASQVALGFVLLSAGGLTIASLATTWRGDAGYDREHLIILPSFLTDDRDGQTAPARVTAFGDVLRATPGVKHAAASNYPIFWGRTGPSWSEVKPRDSNSALTSLQSSRVDAGFFETMGLPVIEGRLPASAEWTSRLPVAIVSRTAARMMWPERSAIGQVLVPVRSNPRQPAAPRTVIAVVGDARYTAIDEDPLGNIYLPEPITPGTYGSFFIVRTASPASDMLTPLIAVATANGFRVEKPTTLRDGLFAALKPRILPAWLFGTLGGVAALVLAAGVLGLFVMAIGRRTREMGIRVALGATTPRIVAQLMREQLRAVGLGLLAGGLVSLWTVRGVSSQLYGIGPYDPTVWAGVAVTIVVIAILATVVPATRAARTDPVGILKSE